MVCSLEELNLLKDLTALGAGFSADHPLSGILRSCSVRGKAIKYQESGLTAVLIVPLHWLTHVANSTKLTRTSRAPDAYQLAHHVCI